MLKLSIGKMDLGVMLLMVMFVLNIVGRIAILVQLQMNRQHLIKTHQKTTHTGLKLTIVTLKRIP